MHEETHYQLGNDVYHFISGWDEDLGKWVASVLEEPTLRAVERTAQAAEDKLQHDLSDVLGPLVKIV